MKNSAYIDYLKTEFDNHLYLMNDQDRMEYHNHLNSFQQGGTYTPYNFKRLKGLFDFYFDIIESTPNDFIKFLGPRERSSIWNLIYNGQNYYINIREELKDKFKPFISSDFDTYEYCLKQCLNTHLDAEQTVLEKQNYYLNIPPLQKEFESNIQSNKKLFEDLVFMGLQNGFLKKINPESLHTKNDEYKAILEKNNVLENINFSENEYAQLIINSYSPTNNNRYRKESNDEKLLSYQLHYIKDIFELVKDYSKFNEWAENNLKPNNTEKPIIEPIKYIEIFTSDYNNISKPLQREFLDNWLKDEEVREFLVKDKYNIERIFMYEPDKILTFLESITQKEYSKILKETNWTYCQFDKSSYNGTFIHNIISLIVKLDTPIETMPKLSQHFVNLYDELPEKMFFGAILSHLTHKFSHKIEASINNGEDNLTQLLNVLSIATENKNLLFSALDKQNNQNISNAIEEVHQNLKIIDKYSKELGLSNNDIKEIHNLVGEKVNSYFSESLEKIDTYQRYRCLNYFQHMLEDLNAYDYVEPNKFIDMTYMKPKYGKSNKQTGYYTDFPIVYDFILSNQPKMIKFILSEENLDKIKSISYNKKGILEYVANVNPKKFNDIIKTLHDNEYVFNEMVLKNKKVMKNIEQLSDPELNKIVDMMSLNLKLKNNLADNSISKNTKPKIKL